MFPKAHHLKRYQEIAWLLVKHGRSDWVKAAGLEGVLSEDGPGSQEVTAEAKSLADDLERLGPTFIKLGQLLSTRPDLLPPPYLTALARLQDKVEPFPFSDVETIVASELGVRLSKAFDEFEPTPLAAASLGQVHRARLRDGRRVAVKVQRPGVRERVAEDLEALAEIVTFLDGHTEVGARYQFTRLLEEFRRSLLRELDYIQEGGNLVTLKRNVAEFPRLFVPAPIEDYTTSRVLTMEYVQGTKITALSPVVLLEMDGAGLAEQLFAGYLEQVLVDGFFHADPHPGNLLLTDDGRLALIDLGMIARVTPRMQDYLLQLVLAVSEGRADEAATAALKLGRPREAFDETELRHRLADLVGRNAEATVEELAIGRVVLELARVSADCGLRLPPELAMLGKTLLHLDEIGRALDPEVDPNALVRRHSAALMQRRLLQSFSPGHLLGGVLETKELMERLPERLNRILERLANNDIEVKVDAIDETLLMTGFQKVANRIALGLVLAALIVGAAMLMQVETTFKILGYPGLAMIFFMLAAAGGVALVVEILFRDR
ncbi:MAG TPA: AarF/UbiB family protein [Methylomirabilota bacterium]|jgi:predicted unusual protein kinase regulating ubiquinone biosynthesis (AarF/ABC1/UbiB family)|nr:AarF/UbiB family protein [Methylomirabilota bacterium]